MMVIFSFCDQNQDHCQVPRVFFPVHIPFCCAAVRPHGGENRMASDICLTHHICLSDPNSALHGSPSGPAALNPPQPLPFQCVPCSFLFVARFAKSFQIDGFCVFLLKYQGTPPVSRPFHFSWEQSSFRVLQSSPQLACPAPVVFLQGLSHPPSWETESFPSTPAPGFLFQALLLLIYLSYVLLPNLFRDSFLLWNLSPWPPLFPLATDERRKFLLISAGLPSTARWGPETRGVRNGRPSCCTAWRGQDSVLTRKAFFQSRISSLVV